MDNNYPSLADISAITKNNGFGEGNGGMWIFALLILLLIGNGGGGLFGGTANAATNADIQRAVDLNGIQQGQAGISADIQRGIYEINAATKDSAYNNLGEIRDVQSAVSSNSANIINNLTAMAANQQTCCCTTQRAIDSVNYNLANQSAAIQANSTANAQKILDALSTNRMADMQSQINQLQMSQALCGIPKISTTAWGVYPYNNAPVPGPYYA